MLTTVLLVTIAVIYFWAFVQVHIETGIGTTNSVLCVIAEVLLVLVLLSLVTDVSIWKQMFEGVWR